MLQSARSGHRGALVNGPVSDCVSNAGNIYNSQACMGRPARAGSCSIPSLTFNDNSWKRGVTMCARAPERPGFSLDEWAHPSVLRGSGPKSATPQVQILNPPTQVLTHRRMSVPTESNRVYASIQPGTNPAYTGALLRRIRAEVK